MFSKDLHIYEVRREQEVEDIKQRLNLIDGIKSVHGDHKTKIFAIQWSAPATWDQIVDVLHEIGYQPAHK
jgi:hypothetical protein